MLVSGGVWSALAGVSSATCRATESTKLLAVPVDLWQQWFCSSPELAAWLEAHPQREDLYSALRPLLANCPRQERTFLDEIDRLQASLRTFQLRHSSDLEALREGESEISWLLSSVNHQLPDVEPYALDGLSPSMLLQAFERSDYGLRLIGYPTAVLHELFDPSSSSSASNDNKAASPADSGVVEELPDWQNLMQNNFSRCFKSGTRTSSSGSGWPSQTDFW